MRGLLAQWLHCTSYILLVSAKIVRDSKILESQYIKVLKVKTMKSVRHEIILPDTWLDC